MHLPIRPLGLFFVDCEDWLRLRQEVTADWAKARGTATIGIPGRARPGGGASLVSVSARRRSAALVGEQPDFTGLVRGPQVQEHHPRACFPRCEGEVQEGGEFWSLPVQ